MHRLREQARSHSFDLHKAWDWREPYIGSSFYPTIEKVTPVPSVKHAIPLILLAGLALPTAHAQADAGTPQWKDTGPVTKRKQQEVNSGSWQPQAQPAPKEDAENPYNEGEDSETYDDGDT